MFDVTCSSSENIMQQSIPKFSADIGGGGLSVFCAKVLGGAYLRGGVGTCQGDYGKKCLSFECLELIQARTVLSI